MSMELQFLDTPTSLCVKFLFDIPSSNLFYNLREAMYIATLIP